MGWREKALDGFHTDAWVCDLADRLEVMRADIGLKESENRKQNYDRGKIERELKVRELILCRIPGKNSKLEDAWEGPFWVERVLSNVNYTVRENEGKKRKRTIHVNCANAYVERNGEGVCALTMLADDMGLEESKVKPFGEVCEQSKEDIEEVLEEFKEEMGRSDGRYVGSEAKIVIEPGAQPKSHKPYRVPDSIRDKVKEAVEQLVTEGRVEQTESAWGAPIIPIPK